MSDMTSFPTMGISSHGGLVPQSFEGMWRISQIFASSGLMPKGMEKAEAVFTAIQYGLEVGLSPMQAVQNIAVVNGRPTIWGDAMLGLVRGSGKLAKIIEKVTGEGDQMEAVCTLWRVGEDDPTTQSFSMADAKRAGLAGKPGPWTQYPRRMLQMRARSFALRDKFPDVLKGLYSREEAADTKVVDGEIIERSPNPLQAIRECAKVDTETGEILIGEHVAPISNDKYQAEREQLGQINDNGALAKFLNGLSRKPEVRSALHDDIEAAGQRIRALKSGIVDKTDQE